MLDAHAFADLWWLLWLPLVAFGSPDPPKPQPAPPPPTDDNAAAQEAQAQERTKQKAKGGRNRTILAGKETTQADVLGASSDPLGGQERTGTGYAGVTGARYQGNTTVPPGAYM